LRGPSQALGGRRAALAFGVGLAVGVLGGLIGLGGAEFRLPALVRLLHYPLRRAVPVNLVVSAFTLGAALIVRSRTLSLEPVVPYAPAVVGLLAGALLGAYLGPALALRLSARQFARLVAALLLGIGVLLIVEAFIPLGRGAAVTGPPAMVLSGLAAGAGIGLVSSLLGVAGGELIIPTLVFIYGMTVKDAGTGAVLISLPTVLVGIGRWVRTGEAKLRAELGEVILPMGAGSVLGAAAGGLLAAVAPAPVIKLLLGLILVFSALRGLGRH